MSLLGHLARRTLIALITLLGITLLTFLVLHLAPGEPAPGTMDEGMRPADAATLLALRERYGLDRPLHRQYAEWLWRTVRLDFGRSFVDNRPVREKMLERLPRTLLLNLTSLGMILVVAVPFGVWTAVRRDGPLDRASAPVLYLLYSLPSFWVALVLQGALAIGLGLFPLTGLRSDGAEAWATGWRWLDTLWHLALPAVCLGYNSLAFFARFSRANLLDALTSDFVRAARARGLAPRRLIWRHALATAWIPFLTLAGLLLPTLVSGSVIIERIFAWPGLGSLLFESLFARDYPTILGLTVLSGLLVLSGALIADLLYLAADPRLRRPGEQG